MTGALPRWPIVRGLPASLARSVLGAVSFAEIIDAGGVSGSIAFTIFPADSDTALYVVAGLPPDETIPVAISRDAGLAGPGAAPPRGGR